MTDIERVTRFDRGNVASVHKTPQGYLRVDGYATRTGVLVYRNPDGSERRELRHPDDVGKAESLATLAGVIVTDNHPYAEPTRALNAENTAKYARGHTGDSVTLDGDLVKVSVTVTDAALIADIEAKRKRQLSPGYQTDLVMEPGVYKGQRYDGRQTNITYNHLAILPRGRAGPEASLRLDEAEQVTDSDDGNQLEVTPVTKINIDGVDYEVSEAVAAAFQAKMRGDASAIETAKADALKAIADAKVATDRADAAEARADAADEKLKTRTDADVPAMVKARLELERNAAKALPAETKLDGLKDSEIKALVVKTASPDLDLAGRSDAYIDARYDIAIEAATAGTDSTGALNQAAAGAKRADADDRADAAEKDMRKRSSEAWQQPLNSKGGK